MTKRSASYDIDPSTFEEKEREPQPQSQLDFNGPHMAGRTYPLLYHRVYKLKRTNADSTGSTDNRDNAAAPAAAQPKPQMNIPGLFSGQQSGQATDQPTSR